MRWFGRSPIAAGAASADELGAYKDGRADERARVEKEVATVRAAGTTGRGDLEDSYARGRRDERLLHRGSPFLTLLAIVMAVMVAAFLYLTATTGSFAGAGAVIDNALGGQVHGAADRAGDALVNAGQNLKARAGSGSQ